MDLAYLWAFCLGYPKATIQNQFAYQVFTNPKPITREYFDLIPYTPGAIPLEGDLVVWGNSYGPAGHIGIAIEGTASTFRVFEQNNPTGTNASVRQRNYNHVLGWLRPKVGGLDNTQLVTDILLALKGSTSDNEIDAWRKRWENSKKMIEDVLREDNTTRERILKQWGVPKEVTKEVIKEVKIEVPVEIIKEVSVEVIKEVPVADFNNPLSQLLFNLAKKIDGK